MDVNVRGTFLTNQEAFPHLRDNGGGRIVNFGSSAGLLAYPVGGHYSASKGAVMAWTRTIAHCWAPHGITANSIAPRIATPMASEVAARVAAAGDPRLAHAQRNLPPAPFGDPDVDLAPVLVFLVGDGSRFVTGQIIPVDGGSVFVR
jgi:NAD(P)-dependent dehydrogenase (short-subunit alcohol dehydrogenase family)